MEKDKVSLQEAENALSALIPVADTINRYAKSRNDSTALLIAGGVDNGDTVSTYVSLTGGRNIPSIDASRVDDEIPKLARVNKVGRNNRQKFKKKRGRYT